MLAEWTPGSRPPSAPAAAAARPPENRHITVVWAPHMQICCGAALHGVKCCCRLQVSAAPTGPPDKRCRTSLGCLCSQLELTACSSKTPSHKTVTSSKIYKLRSSAPHRQPEVAGVGLRTDGLHAAECDGLRQAVRFSARHIAQPMAVQRLHRNGISVVRVVRLAHQHHGMPCDKSTAGFSSLWVIKACSFDAASGVLHGRAACGAMYLTVLEVF